MSRINSMRAASTLAVLAMMLGIGAVSAQTASSLPGGASSLQERHGDWLVTCGVVPQGQAQGQGGGKACLLSQQQVDQSSNRRILSVELRPTDTGAAGTLILPFGLALARGVTIGVDDAAPGDPVPFGTCLPVGCIVRLPITGPLLDAMKKGTALRIKAVAAGGQDTDFSASLSGFSAALTRTAELSK